MVGLLDMPVELLDEIIKFTLPGGVENFVLSCKAIYERAGPQIKRHNQLKQHAKYAYTPNNDHNKALIILYEISRDALLAEYIEVLNLQSESYDSHDSDRTGTLDPEVLDKVKEIVTGSDYLQKAGVDVEDWWERVLKEDEQVDDEDSPCSALSLLGQLPNLRTLRLPESWARTRSFDQASDDDKQLAYVMDSLVEYSNSSEGPDIPLKRLETMLPFMAAGYEMRTGFQCYEPFLPLQGLRELFAISCIAVDDGYTGIPFKWRNPKLSSSLRRLELAYCCMDAEGISELLAHTPHLEVFKYSHETKWHGCQHDWNAGAFVEALARFCSSTLTELALTIDELYGDIINGASSFLGFRKLQVLEMDVQLFCGPPIESGQSQGVEGSKPEGEEAWTEHDIPCIGSMLPGSIVQVTINTDFPGSDRVALKSLLKDIRRQKQERLKHLKSVTIRQMEGTSAKEVCEIAGIVVVVDGNENVKKRRSLLPVWKRGFEEKVGGIEYR